MTYGKAKASAKGTGKEEVAEVKAKEEADSQRE
jgi:hypothetical protein